MRSLRCLVGLYSYDGFLCINCDLGWRECIRCGSLKSSIDEANYDSHVTGCQND